MRCTICDKSDNNLSQYLPDGGYARNFYPDPKDPHKISVICEDCAETFIDSMHEYHLSDMEEDKPKENPDT